MMGSGSVSSLVKLVLKFFILTDMLFPLFSLHRRLRFSQGLDHLLICKLDVLELLLPLKVIEGARQWMHLRNNNRHLLVLV